MNVIWVTGHKKEALVVIFYKQLIESKCYMEAVKLVT